MRVAYARPFLYSTFTMGYPLIRQTTARTSPVFSTILFSTRLHTILGLSPNISHPGSRTLYLANSCSLTQCSAFCRRHCQSDPPPPKYASAFVMFPISGALMFRMMRVNSLTWACRIFSRSVGPACRTVAVLTLPLTDPPSSSPSFGAEGGAIVLVHATVHATVHYEALLQCAGFRSRRPAIHQRPFSPFRRTSTNSDVHQSF